jgi:conjugal transfer ATP-binding protein TraC
MYRISSGNALLKRIINSSNIKQSHSLSVHSIIDYFSYSGLKENVDHIVIDGKYVRVLYISGYPYVASSGWMDSTINFNYDNDISYHIHEVPSLNALPKLHRKITELESTKRSRIRDGKIVSSEITDPLDSAISLRDKILRGQEKLYQVAIYVSLRADDLNDLNKVTSILESTMGSRMFFTKVARYQQLEALQSILPRSSDQLLQKRNLDSSSAALTFPFVSSELVQPGGVLYGINKSNDSLVIIDRFALNNANSITFAQSGSGKSYLSKVEIIRQLAEGTNIIVIDPEREYKDLCLSVNGGYINLSTKSEQHINPFERVSLKNGKREISEHIQELTGILSIMAEGLSAREKAAIDKALLKLYTNFKESSPLLKDLYIELGNLGQNKLCERLEKYITGSLSQVFNHHTDIDINNRLIVFDIKDLTDSMRPLMMLVIANFVSNLVKNKPQKRLLVIDEAWLLLEEQDSAKFISGLVRRARKYYLGVSIITQAANDFLSNEYGKAIASQSAIRILMRQDTTTIKNVVSEFNLSEFEHNYLLNSDRGECLVIVEQTHVSVKIIASNFEHPLITTNPQEVFKANA